MRWASQRIPASVHRPSLYVYQYRWSLALFGILLLFTLAYQEIIVKRPWVRFRSLNGYYNGINTLVSKVDLQTEYPNPLHQRLSRPRHDIKPQPPQIYNPYHPDRIIKECFLDEQQKVPAPNLYAYNGVPQRMPYPALGSYKVLGIRDDVCFDRFGRYGPYGLGYDTKNGGIGLGKDTESSGNDVVWASSGQIDYRGVDWGSAQRKCVEANSDRFSQIEGNKLSRTAVIVRGYQGFKWTHMAILNLRAMITELSLKSGGEYTVHLLVDVHDESPIWAHESVRQNFIDENIPEEFRNITTLWNATQMKMYYQLPEHISSYNNPSQKPLYSAWRSSHFSTQKFAMEHPEYDFFWTWELDIRVVGSYYEMLDRISTWSDSRPRNMLWDISSKFYIPSHHGDWESFVAKHIEPKDTTTTNNHHILGPVNYSGRKMLEQEEAGQSMLPANCGNNNTTCGVDERADLITLSPIFDPVKAGWAYKDDVTGYDDTLRDSLPRRISIVAVNRYSRRLLESMHEEVWRYRHTMFPEMFAPTVALHHGLKAVYAPHPVYIDRAWYPASSLDHVFNAPDRRFEFAGSMTSWYYMSTLAGHLWRKWLGYDDAMGAVASEEEGGRMCLRSTLLHPVKDEKKSHPL